MDSLLEILNGQLTIQEEKHVSEDELLRYISESENGNIYTGKITSSAVSC